MRKRLSLCLLCLWGLGGIGLSAAAPVTPEKIQFSPGSTDRVPSCQVVSEWDGGIQLEMDLPYLEKKQVEVGGKNYQTLGIPGGGFLGEPGEAALPTFTRLLAVPAGAVVQARVLAQEEQSLTGLSLLPDQPDPKKEFLRDEAYYSRSGFGQEPAVVVGQPAKMRHLNVVPITFQPVQYDPSQNEVKVAHRLSVEITVTGGDKAAAEMPAYIPSSFDRIFQQMVFNYDRGSAEVGPGSYLAICPDNSTVINNLQPLLEWRRRQGYNVVLATTAETGTSTTQIKNYIIGKYNSLETPLEFVCLVGDGAGTYTISTYIEGLSGYNGEGDHYYTTLTGGDILSDIHLGRLSYRNTGELTTIVNKIVGYESDPDLIGHSGSEPDDPNWFKRAALVGDPYTQSGWSCVYVNQWAKEQLQDLNYAEIDTNWNPNEGSMFDDFHRGDTIITFRGYLGMSGFSTNYIDALDNREKLHFAVVMTCGTGDFRDTHCQSEAFLRASNGGAVGAVGTATWGTHTRYNNCIWGGVVDGVLNMGDFRFGPALTRGKLEVYNCYHAHEPNQVEIWSVWNNLMGCPATEMWTDVPKPLFVDHPSSLPVGAASVALTVTGTGGVPIPGALVCLYKADQVQVTAFTDAEGQVHLPLDSHTSGSLLVTVTGHNFQPYLSSISLGSASRFVTYVGQQIDDDGSGQSSGNGDGLPNPGETIELAVQVQNLGTSSVNGVEVTLGVIDPYVTILQNSVSYGNLGPGATSWGTGDFVFSIDLGAPARREVGFEITATSSGDNWVSLVPVTLSGAACQARGGFTFGGPGGTPDPGESGTLTIDILNNGDVGVSSIDATLFTNDVWISVTDAGGTYGSMNPGGSGQNFGDPFEIAIAGDCYPGHLASFEVRLEFPGGARDTLEFLTTVGYANSDDPLGPDQHGYYAFDNTDTGYEFAPVYNWVEIDPAYGGSGTSLGIIDGGEYQDKTVVRDLPFDFDFYGQTFDRVSVCSNGWIAMGATYLKNYRNWSLPCSGGPDNILAVFWDDLEATASNKIFDWYDAVNHRYVVEWSRVRNDIGNAAETLEVILYDPAHHPTDTGDGLIVYQYHTVNNVDGTNGYATVGIQNEDHSDALLYTYWNDYADGAAVLTGGRAIAFRPVVAQLQGFLEGNVTNLTGGGSPVEGAVVKVVENGRTMTTQANGHYFGTCPPGVFSVAVSHPSFAPDTTYNVVIVQESSTVVDFSLPDIGGPTVVADSHPNTDDTVGPYLIPVTITDYSPITETHFYYTSSGDGGSTHELALQLIDSETGLYQAEIPGQTLGSVIQYWATASDVAGNQGIGPEGAPWTPRSFLVVDLAVVLADDMETNQGWTVGDTGDDATTGIWVRVNPNGVWDSGTLVQPEDDATPDPGVLCYITGNDPPGSSQGTDDVDGGKTTLLSPWFDLTQYQDARVTYKRWYTNNTGSSPGEDYWVVQVTDDGSQWHDLENTNTSNRSWYERSFLLGDYIDLTSTVRFRFIASDEGSGSVVEAGVDDFLLEEYFESVDSGPPSVTVLAPNGGENLSAGGGETYTVSWQASDDIGVVQTHVLLSVDGGNSYPDTIASGYLGTSFEWLVPDISEPSCRIRVVCLDAVQNQGSDISDADFMIGLVSAVEGAPTIPLALAQNQPNPFNPRTEIRFSLPSTGHVSLRVFDVEGRLVTTLLDEIKEAGQQTVIWSGQNDAGAKVASGLYFYRLNVAGEVLTRKMLLLK